MFFCFVQYWPEIKGRLDGTRAVGRAFAARGASVLFSQYEDMTARPEAWATHLQRFLGLGGDDEGVEGGAEGSVDAGKGGGAAEGEAAGEAAKARARRQRAWLRALALAQRTVVPAEHSHTAFFMPGAHLKLLRNTTLSWLY